MGREQLRALAADEGRVAQGDATNLLGEVSTDVRGIKGRKDVK